MIMFTFRYFRNEHRLCCWYSARYDIIILRKKATSKAANPANLANAAKAVNTAIAANISLQDIQLVVAVRL